ncbi:MAG: exo-alpha-sialidase [Acidobacteria bacterium]|nr:exo-alpha-sialidase [Acidobacteriota bacterium]
MNWRWMVAWSAMPWILSGTMWGQVLELPPEQVRAFEISVMERIADLALIPPKLNTEPLPQYDYDQLDYGMTIGIARTPKGRLWAAWVAGEDGPKAYFVLATSDDDGVTWSKPRLVVDGQSKTLPMYRSVLVGNVWVDPLGRLWLFFNQSMMQFDGRSGSWAAVCENPDAEAPVWGKPRRIWHGFTLNKPTVLTTGEWMLPVSLNPKGFGPFEGAFRELDGYRGANWFVSADQGATWRRQGHVQFPNATWDEHMVVEKKDGSLWMLARTTAGIMQSTSTDRGRTWAEPSEPVGIRHPVARFHVRRLASGRILLVKHGERVEAHEGRSKLTAWLSEDEGATWRGGLMLDERTGVSYPDGFQAPDGSIYISYDRNRSADGEILMAKFTEADVLARELVSGGSRLKVLISRPGKRQAR